jgi:glycosyltransferase involved in cell wall biosynthesis
MFVENYVGGAELTSEALIQSSPLKVFKLLAKHVTTETLEQGYKKHWIFGNFSSVEKELIPTIVANMQYSILEYDYKYCKYRSPEKHEVIEKQICDCENHINGKMISAFLYGAKSLWWMSERQVSRYHDKFPFLKERHNCVLSSVFDDKFFVALKILRKRYENHERKGWIILGSTSWIKGAQEAEQWCIDNKKEYEVVWNLPYEDLLEKLAQAEGFTYLPQGGDTCPRMVIEAKLLGCQLHINDYVEHANEIWFNTDDMFDTEAYLYAARERFWTTIKQVASWSPTLSGYTTTMDCYKNQYPWEQSVQSMLGLCDEVVVVDGGSTDGTWEKLKSWAESEPRLVIDQVNRDWDDPRFAVFDGQQKAESRHRCTMDFCWQLDADEVIHEDDYEKIRNLLREFPQEVDIVSLPVIEYWGSANKVRMDINPWKWRVSRNKPYITHGIPVQLRKYDENDSLYAAVGTDGCDYIDKESGEVLAHANFYNPEAHVARQKALNGDDNTFKEYTSWFNRCVELLPSIHHYSWFNLERKIKTYRDYWSQHWQSLYNIKQEDTPENNMFFDKCWEDVTDKDIRKLAKALGQKMGGWVFHSKINFNMPTPHVTIERAEPKLMTLDYD